MHKLMSNIFILVSCIKRYNKTNVYFRIVEDMD